MKNAIRFPWEFDGETVVFETPEQTRIEYRIAPLGTRLVAALLDRLLISSVVFILWALLLLCLLVLAPAIEHGAGYLAALLVVAWFLFAIFYFVWGEVRGEGQTWGKRRLHIRTLMFTGQGVTLGASLVRNLARLVDDFPLLWILPAFTRGKRRMGDLLAGTLVVMAEKADAPRARRQYLTGLARSYADLSDRQFYFSSELAAKLYPDDLNLLEHLEERLRHSMPRQRDRTLAEVARKYIGRLGLQADEERIERDPRRFLQEMALFLKDRFEGEAY